MCCHLVQVNGSLPEKVIVYRDGVGDGDMKMITDFEIPQFFEGFSMFGRMIIIEDITPEHLAYCVSFRS